MTDTPPDLKGQVRGSVVGARLAYAASRWGEAARDDIVSAFDEAQQKRMRSVAIEGDWFAYPLVAQIDSRLAELAGDDPSVGDEVGAFAAEAVFKRIQSQLGAHEPDKLVERLGRACQQLQDFAQCEVKQIGVADENRGTAFEFKYSVPVSPFYCKARLAFMSRTIELLGLRVISAEEKICGGGPERVHRFDIWWSPVILVEETDEPDDKTRQLYRQAVTADHPGHPTGRVSLHGKRRFGVTRGRVMGFILLVLVTAWAATDGYTWLQAVTAPPVEISEEFQSHLFTCNGPFEVDITFDSSSVTLRNKEEVLQAQIIVEQAGRSYIKSLDIIEANGSIGIPISEFRDDVGRVPNRYVAPSRIRLLSLAGLRDKETVCAPKPPKVDE